MSNPKLIAVLGGGVAGLAAAHRLAGLGHRVRLFEQDSRLGGSIRTEEAGGWLAEGGPNSLQEGPELRALIRELGLESERVEAGPAARNRYLLRDGRPVPVPLSPGGLFKSPLFSAGAKLRVLSEFFARRRRRPGDASLADFIRDHFGAELLERAVQPIVSGIYAGDPARLSTREAFPKFLELEESHGSLLRGMIAGARARRAAGGAAGPPKIISFRRGLQALPDALAARLPAGAIALNSTVERIIPGGRWRVAVRGGPDGSAEEFDAVIAALPAPALAALVVGLPGETPLSSLSGIGHPPVSSLFLGFRRGQVAHPLDGFGLLVPAIERRSVLGVLFSSSLFPGRAPDGHVALTVMTGGALQPGVARLPTADLVARVLADLGSLLGVGGEPVFCRHTFWPRAIPQYNLGYGVHRETMAACERAHPGLFIAGQARNGISVPDCLAAGRAAADKAAA